MELQPLLMIPLGRTNANQINDENAESQAEAATVVMEMIVVDEIGG
jgi:hypothetical protein